MTGTPTDPDDSNLTKLYDPPPPTSPETPAESPDTPAPSPETPAQSPETPAPSPETPVPSPAVPSASPPAAPVATSPPPAPMWRSRATDGRTGTIVFGVILVAIGLWFFGDQTLGLDMPALSWSDLWPILIIALGGWIVLGSLRRDA
jgi:hypothetical protein